MKIIIAGCGKVGSALTRHLSSEGYELTLIDTDSDVISALAEQYDVMALTGNCAAMDVLRHAGVEDADLLIALAGADEVNLLACTTAHAINSSIHTIARIRNPEYTEQAIAMRDVFALSLAVNPEHRAATEIERLLKYPGFLKRDSFAKGRVEIVELLIDENSKLCNVPLVKLDSIIKCKVLVCTVQRGNATMTPRGDFVLQEGDRIFVTAPTNVLATLLKNLGIFAHKVRRVMIAGGGTVSYYLAEKLLSDGMSVQIVEHDHARCMQLASLLPEAEVLHGDASNRALLTEMGMGKCDAVVTLTGMDEQNIVISLFAHSEGVPKTVTKLSRIDTDAVINGLPLGSVVSPKELCCNTIVRYVRALKNQVGAAVSVHSIANGMAEAIEFSVDESTEHVGEMLRDIRIKRNVLVAGITRGMRTILPDGNSSFAVGDTVIIVSSGEDVIYQLNDIFVE